MKKLVSLVLTLILFSSNILPSLAATKTEENNYIKVERKTRHLHSRLSKKYTGYDYEIKNVYNEPVKIEGISVRDNASGKVAYLSVKRTGGRAAAETLAAGTALALPTLTLSLIGAVVAVPFIIVGNQIGNVGANQEAHRYDTLQNESVVLKPHEAIAFKTMALHRHAPSVRVIFINPLTEENMELELK